MIGDEIVEAPPPGGAAIPPPAGLDEPAVTPPSMTTEYGGAMEDDIQPPADLFDSPPPPPAAALQPEPEKPRPSITDMMKNPSKIVLCKNMVGPGEVDDELEPEVMDECGTKYGDVNKVGQLGLIMFDSEV